MTTAAAIIRAAQGLALDLSKGALGSVVSQTFENCKIPGCSAHALVICRECSKHACIDHAVATLNALPPRVVCVACVVADYREYKVAVKNAPSAPNAPSQKARAQR